MILQNMRVSLIGLLLVPTVMLSHCTKSQNEAGKWRLFEPMYDVKPSELLDMGFTKNSSEHLGLKLQSGDTTITFLIDCDADLILTNEELDNCKLWSGSVEIRLKDDKEQTVLNLLKEYDLSAKSKLIPTEHGDKHLFARHHYTQLIYDLQVLSDEQGYFLHFFYSRPIIDKEEIKLRRQQDDQ